MPRQLQSKIHSDFSSETYKWEIYQAQLQELFDASTETEDFNDHLVREYNRKISRLNQSSFLYIDPYDGGYRLTNNVVNGLKLSLDLNFDANTTYSQSTVGSTTFTLASRYGPNALFSRLSPATFRGSNGLIQYAPENLLQYSEQFDATPYWTPNQVAVAPNQITSPSGLVNAYRLTTNGSAAVQRIGQNSTLVGVSTYSIYVKAGTASFVQILHGSSVNVYANFNVSTGSVGNVGALTTASIQSVGNGWYRCVVYTAAIITGSSWYIYIAQSNTAAYGAAFSATVANLYVWGAQLERSSTARPYISTTSTAVYGPRLEYDINGNALGLLIEESSSNLLAYSEQFDNPYWAKPAVSITPNDATAPNDTTTADKVVFSGANLEVKRQVVVSGTTTASIYIKGTAGQTIAFSNGGVSPAVDVIHTLTGGWDRVVFTTTATNPYVSVNTYNSVTARTIHIWGAQLEQKAYPTSYIPTATSGGIARAADTCTLNIDFPLTWFNESEGTIMVEGDRLHDPALNAGLYDSLFIFSAGGGASLGHFGDGTSELFAASDGSNIVTALSVSLPNQPLLFVGSYSASSGEIYVSTNNTVTQSQAGFSGFSTPDTITFGYSLGINEYLNGHIKSFKYYKKSLDSTIMEALPL